MKKLKGADMDIDLIPDPNISWKKSVCPWNAADGTNSHKCALKSVSICKYFKGIEEPDVVLCDFSENV